MKKQVRLALIGSIVIFYICCSFVQAKDSAYVGQWDPKIYNLLEHPKTVCLRIEVLDSETRLPIEDARVSFKGVYMTEKRTSRHPKGEQKTQEKEFELIARTGKDGVVIAALGWEKEFPWRHGTDEIEKVQLVEIVRKGYRYVEKDIPFSRFLNVGQKKGSDFQDPNVIETFEKAWVKEYARKDVKLCTPRLNKDFPDFKKKKSKHSVLFEKIRRKEWGIIYKKPINLMKRKDRDEILCGPYLIYTLKIYIDRTEFHYRRGNNDTQKDSSGNET